MSDYPNFNNRFFANNELFQNLMSELSENVFARQDVITYKDRLAVIMKGNKFNYLFYRNGSTVEIYQEQQNEWRDKPFEYALKSMQSEEGTVYAGSRVVQMIAKDASKIKKLMELLKGPEFNDDERKKFMSTIGDVMFNNQLIIITHVSYFNDILRDFLDFAYEQKLISQTMPNGVYEQLSIDMAKEISRDTNNFNIKLPYLQSIAFDKGYSKKNKFTFNDSDNHFWASTYNQAFCFDSQNFGYLCVPENNGWTVYAYSSEGYAHFNKESDLILAIKNNQIDKVRDIALIIEDGKIVFATGHANGFNFYLNFTAQTMQEETGSAIEYPVDINSYDYQLRWHASHYNINETEFLAQALLTLGGGFDIDSQGRLFSDDVIYEPDTLNFVMPANPKKQDTINYCETSKLRELRSGGIVHPDWFDGMKKLVAVLENDCPNVIATRDAKKDVEKAIKELHKTIDFFVKKSNTLNMR